MRRASAYIAALLAVMTAGCVLSGKNAKPAVATPAMARPSAPTPAPPPPKPLSQPQTQVELPSPQPVDPAALTANPPADLEVRETPPAARPAPPRPRPAAQPRNEPAQPVAAAPADPTPPPIQEIVPAAESRRLQDSAQARRREVQQILDQLGRRRLTATQRNIVTNINSFLTSSLDAERRGDMKLADALADRAQILARDLANGK